MPEVQSIQVASAPTAPAGGSGQTTYQLGEHEVRLNWKNGEIDQADAVDPSLETMIIHVQGTDPTAARLTVQGVEQACIQCWRVNGGPWTCIPIPCP